MDENSTIILIVGTCSYSDIPAILDIRRFVNLCVSWRHRHWQRFLLHISDSMDALEAVRSSMLADLTG